MAKELQGKGWVASWRPEALFEDNDRLLALGVAKAAAIVEREMKESLGKPGPTKTHATGTELEGGETVRPSRPGEPPRRREGILLSSVSSEKSNDSGTRRRVGTHLPYGLHLEFGTKRGLKPRPWLRPALKKKSDEMNEAIATTMAHGDRSTGNGLRVGNKRKASDTK